MSSLTERGAEFEYIAHELSFVGLPADLAMFFCTQEDFTLDHLFAKEYDTSVEFYKDVWNYIKAYTERKLNQGQFDVVFRDILPKCWFGTWDTRLQNKKEVLRHGFVIRYIEWILEWFHERGRYFELIRVVDHLASITEIPEDSIYQLLYHHPEWCTDEVLSEMIRQEYLSLQCILELLIQKRKGTTLRSIQDIILHIFQNGEMILQFLLIVKSQYNVEVTADEKNMNLIIEPIRQDKEECEYLEEIRLYLRDLIVTDCELDLYEFLDTSYVTSTVERNVGIADIYRSYLTWLSSEERMKEQIPHYCYFGNEDTYSKMLQMTDDDYAIISTDLELWKYIHELSLLDVYRVFIRAFNINRLRLFTFNNQGVIHQYYKEVAGYYESSIIWAIDHSVYYFLIYSGNK